MDRVIKFRFWRDNRMQIAHEMNAYEDNRFDGDGEILMQFTGLIDCEGKEIYEGDILRWTSWEGVNSGTIIGIYIVKWNDEGSYILHDPYENTDWPINDTEFENVIGNIYEHSNLLNNG